MRSTLKGFVLGVQRIGNFGLWDERRCFSQMLGRSSHWLVLRYVIPEASKDYHKPGVKPFLDLVELTVRALDGFATKPPSEVLTDQSVISIRVCDFNRIVLAMADQSMEAVQCAVRIAKANSDFDQEQIFSVISASQSDTRRP